jgi:hypothetical protein
VVGPRVVDPTLRVDISTPSPSWSRRRRRNAIDGARSRRLAVSSCSAHSSIHHFVASTGVSRATGSSAGRCPVIQSFDWPSMSSAIVMGVLVRLGHERPPAANVTRVLSGDRDQWVHHRADGCWSVGLAGGAVVAGAVLDVEVLNLGAATQAIVALVGVGRLAARNPLAAGYA